VASAPALGAAGVAACGLLDIALPLFSRIPSQWARALQVIGEYRVFPHRKQASAPTSH